ncbi:glycosyltransferase family 4 protein [Chthonobacter rhizosphaerae]|uniref:glycosyltransferase family 4 protein n=1 Tax=Chthonobacter rhizosphaerae TaxID=2735553 RepID=UPI0015EFAEBA|nr:glycosyltransferase family 4 protein [Chthonobacter rhizosphaerae]
MLGTFGLLARGFYDTPAIDAEIRGGARPTSEFHALQQFGGFRMVDISPPKGVEESWLGFFSSPRRIWPVRRAVKDLGALVAAGEDVGLPTFLGLTAYGVRIPMVCILHGTYFESPRFRALMPVIRAMRHIHFLGLSRAVTDHLVTEFGMPAERTGVITAGVDTAFFAPAPLRGEGVIASAGVAFRDYDTLFKAVEGLPAPVELATNSAWIASVRFDAPLPSNVKAGELPMYTGLRDLYARSRFVVVPTQPAPFACGYSVIAEAMAMGKAVIATYNPGHSDLIVHGETGLYVPCRDPDAMRAAIVRLLENPAEAARMGEAGRRRAVETNTMPLYAALVRRQVAALADRVMSAAVPRPVSS